jgi:hypothetical protein
MEKVFWKNTYNTNRNMAEQDNSLGIHQHYITDIQELKHCLIGFRIRINLIRLMLLAKWI